MHSLVSDFFQIKSFVFRLLDKCKIVDNRKHYTLAVTKFQDILKDTSTKLENVYYQHILCPQINYVHEEIREKTIHSLSVLVVMYITMIHPIN